MSLATRESLATEALPVCTVQCLALDARFICLVRVVSILRLLDGAMWTVMGIRNHALDEHGIKLIAGIVLRFMIPCSFKRIVRRFSCSCKYEISATF